MAKLASAAALAALLIGASAPLSAWAQARGDVEDPDFGRDRTSAAGTRFHCQDGGELIAHFETSKAKFVAVVDALDGYGPHALPARPWTGGPVVITWSDGQRTLTWSPGVQIMWMDGSTHRMCGREGHHH
jgi:hypothetical protein